jgi:tetratricopeptide (TPR) repeat protein
MKNAMMKTVCSVLVGLLLSISSFAQWTASETKAVDKSVKLYNSGKYDKAITTISKVQDAHPFDEKLWSYRVVYEHDRYNAEYNRVLGVIIKQSNAGKNVKVNTEKLTSYKISMLVACLQATMYAEKEELASNILRNYLVDPDVDTAIGDAAKEHYEDGDKEYNNENWTGAIKEYKKAVAKDSNYFNATYSIGMAYYKNSDYEQAIPWFKKAIRIEPDMANSYISCAESYIELKQWENAKNMCIDGILVYPEVTFFEKLEKCADKMDKSFSRHWQERIVTPNDITSTQSTPSSGPFQYYRTAKDKISDNCNDDGIVTKTASFTEQKYLESYSWEYMLKKSSEDEEKDYPEMKFARKMQEAGFLDCYCFVSCYHVNFHKQYKDFSKKNADRIRTYVNTYLMK